VSRSKDKDYQNYWSSIAVIEIVLVVYAVGAIITALVLAYNGWLIWSPLRELFIVTIFWPIIWALTFFWFIENK